jgi:DNA-binding protein HU-beta
LAGDLRVIHQTLAGKTYRYASDVEEIWMNRTELVKATAAHTGLEPKMVDQVLRGTVEVITAVTAKAEPVTISGFAKFVRVDRPARMARNPATGAPVKVKASKKAKITPLKAYKDAVLTPSTAPKLAKGVWPLAAVTKATAARKTAPATRATATTRPATKAPARRTPAAPRATAAPAKRATKR